MSVNNISLDGKLSIAHDDAPINLDGASAWNDIDMDFGIPIGTRELWIRIAERNMQAGHLLILQQVADQPLQARESADGKFSYAIAIGNREQVVPYFLCQRCIFAGDFRHVPIFYSDSNWLL